MKYRILFVFIVVINMGCIEDPLPKPKAMLRLQYPQPEYSKTSLKDFKFDRNLGAEVKDDGGSSVTLDYPMMKGSIYLTHKKVENNLDKLLTDAQKLSYEHTIKADNILEQPFVNEEDKVYGMFYEVTGNAASQSQFYVTDSTENFVTGSLYFYAKPNYDSIYPAAIYLQRDIRRIMETLKWKK